MNDKIKFSVKTNNEKMGRIIVTTQPPISPISKAPDEFAYEIDNDTIVKLEAFPAPGYRFVGWDDGCMDSKRELSLTTDTIFTAFFCREGNIPQDLFIHLLNYKRPNPPSHKDCPAIEPYGGDNDTGCSDEDVDKIKDYPNHRCSKSCKWMLPTVITILLTLFLIFMLNGCSASGDTIISTKMSDNHIKSDFSNNENNTIVVNVARMKNQKPKIIKDTIIVKDTSTVVVVPCNTIINYRQPFFESGGGQCLCRIILAIILATLIALAIKFIMPYYLKKIDHENKMCEQQYIDYVRILDENRDYIRLLNKTNIQLFEKREKTKMEEWQRDNEHQRKLAVMEQERIAELSNVLVDLAKVKNTVVLHNPNCNDRNITIERSILSDDCCAQLLCILEGHLSQNDNCCDKIIAVLKCLCKNHDCCEYVKKVLKILLNRICNNNNNADIVAVLEKLIASIQQNATNGLQQVVNISGSEKESSAK